MFFVCLLELPFQRTPPEPPAPPTVHIHIQLLIQRTECECESEYECRVLCVCVCVSMGESVRLFARLNVCHFALLCICIGAAASVYLCMLFCSVLYSTSLFSHLASFTLRVSRYTQIHTYRETRRGARNSLGKIN